MLDTRQMDRLEVANDTGPADRQLQCAQARFARAGVPVGAAPMNARTNRRIRGGRGNFMGTNTDTSLQTSQSSKSMWGPLTVRLTLCEA
jgi:hypothetical protein